MRFPALVLAGVHLVLVGSLGLKLAADRRLRPRVWVRAAPMDPDLPLRGRYLSLRVEVPVRGTEWPPEGSGRTGPRARPHLLWVRLRVEGQGLRAEAQGGASRLEGPSRGGGQGDLVRASLPESMRGLPEAQWRVTLQEPVAFFIPGRGADPSRLAPGEELWVEATLPRKGPLRPIRLAIRQGDAFRVLPF